MAANLFLKDEFLEVRSSRFWLQCATEYPEPTEIHYRILLRGRFFSNDWCKDEIQIQVTYRSNSEIMSGSSLSLK
jgi:hypothetical protein